MIPTVHALVLAGLLFAIGVHGLVSQKNALRILIAVELILNAANLNFVAFANHYGHMDGIAFAVFTIALAAGEAAVGLAIFIHLYRHVRSVDVTRATRMRW